MWLHAIGGLLLAARLIHPFGIIHDKPAAPARIAGALGTTLSMVMAIVVIIWQRLA